MTDGGIFSVLGHKQLTWGSQLLWELWLPLGTIIILHDTMKYLMMVFFFPKSRGLLCIFCILFKALKSLCNVKHVCGETLCCLFLCFYAKIEQEEFVINGLQLFSEKVLK